MEVLVRVIGLLEIGAGLVGLAVSWRYPATNLGMTALTLAETGVCVVLLGQVLN